MPLTHKTGFLTVLLKPWQQLKKKKAWKVIQKRKNPDMFKSDPLYQAAPAVPVYSSTLILMIIAADRYHTIVFSGGRQLMPKHVLFIAPFVLGTYGILYEMGNSRLWSAERKEKQTDYQLKFCCLFPQYKQHSLAKKESTQDRQQPGADCPFCALIGFFSQSTVNKLKKRHFVWWKFLGKSDGAKM